MTIFKKALKALGTVLMVPIILFEEWGWRPLARFMARLAHLPFIQRLEVKISQLPRGIALGLFAVPAIALLPFKFGALWLIANGQKVMGIAVILLAKVVSTAILGRLFILTEKQLMTFSWFAKAYTWWRDRKSVV